ncbi:MAG: adenosylcobinamide-GDP ribazoletransferase [Chloroflexi bacterium]|nr:adenosylcobinamide-GDP ribazoletransferase [Chloroflexota bacterium]
MKSILAPFFSALRFLTNIDVPFWREDWSKEDSPKQFTRSLIYYPLVGLIIGLILAAVYWLADSWVPPILTSAVIVALLAWLTGALHLDGFADCADGVAASHKDEATRDRIMKEPGVGAMAVIAVIILLLLKFAALCAISDEVMIKALIVTPVLSRWAMAMMVYIFPYKRKSGMGQMLKELRAPYVIIVPTIVTLIITLLAFSWMSIVIMALAAFSMLMCAFFYRSKLQGLSGDTYGAANEVTEAVIFIFFALQIFSSWGFGFAIV